MDLETHGDALWDRFTGKREGSLWYYHRLTEVFVELDVPEALRRGMDLVQRSRSLAQQEAVELADAMRRRSFTSADFEEGVRAFFEKRSPKWPSLEQG